MTSICKSMDSGIFATFDNLSSSLNGLLRFSGDDINSFIQLWNQLVKNLPYDHILTFNLVNSCTGEDFIESSVNRINEKMSELIRYVKIAAWPLYPIQNILDKLIFSIFDQSLGLN